MCKVTKHAIDRAIERMGATSEKDATGRLTSAFNRAKFVGVVTGQNNRQARLFVDSGYKVTLIVAIDSDVVITVIRPEFSHVAPELFDDVVRMHLDRLGSIETQRVAVMKRAEETERDRPLIDAELQSLDKKILFAQARLNAMMARRAALEQYISEDRKELQALDRRESTLIKSLGKVTPTMLWQEAVS